MGQTLWIRLCGSDFVGQTLWIYKLILAVNVCICYLAYWVKISADNIK